MPHSHILADAAEADLREIIRHTRKCWGDAQARRYVARLEQAFARVSDRQGVFQTVSALYPSLRMTHCEHHFVFCLLRENAPALIVAILHERMDLIARLADRLNTKANTER